MTGKVKDGFRHRILLSAGMPRAGSAWFYNLTKDLWLAAGRDDIRDIREKFYLQTVITEVNQNIDNFTLRKSLLLLIPFLAGKAFTIKIHFAPMLLGRWMIGLDWLRPTFIYRDPRDALLSAYEYGRRVEKTGRVNAFSHLDTIEKAIHFMHGYMDDWEKWMILAHPNIFRYEDLLTDFDQQVERLISFLQVDPSSPKIQKAIQKNRPRNAEKKDGGHYNKGKIGRFREVLSPDQIALCNDLFSTYFDRMGYDI
jgi:hypothetical protein